MKTYKISQGKHRSGIYTKPHIFKCNLLKTVTFNKSAVYQFDDVDQYDINKLFGLSYGYHHNNSARFGWRSPGKHSSMIEIVAYCYVDGKRVKEDGHSLFVAMVPIDEPFEYKLHTNEKAHYFTVTQGMRVLGTKEIPHNGVPCWGYHLYPYFGGNKKAPHNITIDMK